MSRPPTSDATGRRAAFLPAAIVGNGSLLVTLSARGEVERLFWPRVDGGQHLAELRLGIALDGPTLWLDEEPFAWEQAYETDASILRTIARGAGGGVEIVDLVAVDEPVLLRRVRSTLEGRLVVYCRADIEERRFGGAAYVDPETGALVFYRGSVVFALGARPGEEVTLRRTQRGALSSVRDDSDDGRLVGGSVAHRAPIEGALAAELDGDVLVVLAFGATPCEALDRLDGAFRAGFGALEGERRAHDAARLAACPEVPEALEPLVRRSILTLELLADRETGGVIAAPEMDPEFLHSGGYGFVWPRDLAFVVLGLLAGRQADLAAAALRWCTRVQTPEGLWLQRHWTDGALAPSWSLHQIDETGTVLAAYEAAWRELGDAELDAELWPSARRAADFLCSFLDEETGLPRPSVDLWEQHEGQHSYSAAAVCGGLRAAASMAARHGGDAARYLTCAERVAAGIEAYLWSEERGTYLRSRLVGRSDADADPVPPLFVSGLPYPNLTVRSVDPFDEQLDASILGLAWPFRAVDPASPRMRATAAAIERALTAADGGLLRYAGDAYAGGNPWLLTTLWLGLHHRQVGDEAGYRRCLEYVAERRTALDLLPEQVDVETGQPVWVLPLAWSHAMLLLAARPELDLA